MLPLINKLSGYIKGDIVKISGPISAGHYRVTTGLLLLSCALVSSQQYFGTPIQCVQDFKKKDDAAIPDKVINTFCFIMSTYSKLSIKEELGGIMDEKVKKHSYYQWVPLVLLIQAVLFAAPHYIWSHMDAGLMEACCKTLSVPLLEPRTYKDHILKLAKYMSLRFHSFGSWALGNLLHDFLNVFNVFLNFFFTDFFLKGNFSFYGIQVSSYLFSGESGMVSPMDDLFPKLTKCEFRKFGPSGTIQKHDVLCLMALNVINEKIFLFLWSWFLLLGLVSLTALAARLIKLTALLASSKYNFFKRFSAVYDGTEETTFLLENLYISDLIFLEQLKANIDDPIFQLLIHSVCNFFTSSPHNIFDLDSKENV